jgi:hypothetical protein
MRPNYTMREFIGLIVSSLALLLKGSAEVRERRCAKSFK